jgi:hypothetical protein
LRAEWQAAKAHEDSVLAKKLPPAPAPLYNALPSAQSVVPAGYIDIAQKMLFSKDRNATVIVPPPAPPPPPPPMPALPVLHGVMNIGDGPTAIMSAKAGAAHRDIKPGDKVGEFKLVAVNNEEIVLEWNGQAVRRRLEELLDRTVAAAPTAPAPAAVASGPAASAPAGPANLTAKSGPGVDIGNGIKACVAGDSAAPGTVMDGLKKVTWETPFGKGCRWEPAK